MISTALRGLASAPGDGPPPGREAAAQSPPNVSNGSESAPRHVNRCGPRSNSPGPSPGLKWSRPETGNDYTFMSPPRRSRARNAFRTAGLVVAGLAIACASAWGAGLLYFAGPSGEHARAALAIVPAVVGLGVIGALFVPRWRGPGLATFGIMFVALLAWWSGIQPSNDREWRAEARQAFLRHDRRRSRDRPQHPQLRLPHRDRLHAALLRPHVRSPQARQRRSRSPSTGWAPPSRTSSSLSTSETITLRCRSRRARSDRELLDARRFFPPVRAHLHRGRRARRDSPAHQLSQGPAGGRLSHAAERHRSRTDGGFSSNT